MKTILHFTAAIFLASGIASAVSAANSNTQDTQAIREQKDLPSADFQILAARYPNWSRLSGCPAEKVQYDFLTHIIYSGYTVNSHGVLANSDPADDANFKTLIKLAHGKGVKVLLSVAGSSPSDGFKSMAAGESSRARFIRNVLGLVDDYSLDGVDLAWKFPIAGDGDNQLRLHRELRLAVDKHSRKLLFTAEVPPTDWFARHSADEALSLPDYLFVLCFDFARDNAKRAVPNAGLGMIQGSLEYFERRGVPKSKLVIGTPFYGRTFAGASTLGAGSTGKGSGNDGLWPWKDLLVRFKAGDYRMQWDEATESEYAVGGGELVSFNGLAAQRARARFTRNHAYAGLAAWDLPDDTDSAEQSLLVALHQGLWGDAKGAGPKPPAGPKWEGSGAMTPE